MAANETRALGMADARKVIDLVNEMGRCCDGMPVDLIGIAVAILTGKFVADIHEAEQDALDSLEALRKDAAVEVVARFALKRQAAH